MMECLSCKGAGRKPNFQKCTTCQGAGRISQDVAGEQQALNLAGVLEMTPTSDGDSSKSILTQQDMMDLFNDTIMESGVWMRKVNPCMAREAELGEHIQTKVGKMITSDTVVGEAGMVIIAPTADQEEYFLNTAKFSRNWRLPGTAVTNAVFHKRGYRKYHPQESVKKVYRLKEIDVQRSTITLFKTSWGATQQMPVGDFLCSCGEGCLREIYLMPADVISQYEEAYEYDAFEENSSSEEDDVDRHAERPLSTTRIDWTQDEMIREFRPQVLQHGEKMVKVKRCNARPAVLNERVITKIGMKTTSDTVIAEEGHMVIQAATLDHELYALPQEKFAMNWEMPGKEIMNTSLRENGWMRYTPKLVVKTFLEITENEIHKVPTRKFRTKWGVVQSMHVGDYLCLNGEGEASELYIVVKSSHSQYLPLAKVLGDSASQLLGKTVSETMFRFHFQTLCAQGVQKDQIHKHLYEVTQSWHIDDIDDTDVASRTVACAFELICAAAGGALLIVAPLEDLRKLDDPRRTRTVSADKDYLINRLATCGGVQSEDFKRGFLEFTEHTSNDRWPHDYRDERARGLPKDGAVLLEHTGQPWMCAVKLRGIPVTEFEWPGFGTRHETALEVTCFLERVVTFVRSDAGSVHVLFKNGEEPIAYCVE